MGAAEIIASYLEIIFLKTMDLLLECCSPVQVSWPPPSSPIAPLVRAYLERC